VLVEEEERMLSRKAQPGFSLVELCIVMVIMAILMALGLRPYREWIENNKIRTTAESINNGLALARSEAVTRNTNVSLTLAAGTSSSWTVGCAAVTPTCPAAIHNRQMAEGSSAAITAISPAGRAFIFDNMGRLVPPAGISIAIDNTELTPAISRDLQVTVSGGGSIRMCDPNVAASDARAC
jgi:type IV fimbrial biogenesis protein FimT